MSDDAKNIHKANVKWLAANLTHEQLCLLVSELAVRLLKAEWAVLGQRDASLEAWSEAEHLFKHYSRNVR